MKGKFLLLAGLGTCILLSLCFSFYFQKTQKAYFKKITEEYCAIQRNLRNVEDDLFFLKQHDKEINFLTKKGWLLPQSRLIGSETINQWVFPLHSVRFTIEPEVIKEMKEGHNFKMSKIIVEIDGLLDKDIYEFIENILKNFPGILILRKFSVLRNEKVNKTNLLGLKQHKRPNFVGGEIILEWFAIKGEKNEE